jgi:hypothetical protein
MVSCETEWPKPSNTPVKGAVVPTGLKPALAFQVDVALASILLPIFQADFFAQ